MWANLGPPGDAPSGQVLSRLLPTEPPSTQPVISSKAQKRTFSERHLPVVTSLTTGKPHSSVIDSWTKRTMPTMSSSPRLDQAHSTMTRNDAQAPSKSIAHALALHPGKMNTGANLSITSAPLPLFEQHRPNDIPVHNQDGLESRRQIENTSEEGSEIAPDGKHLEYPGSLGHLLSPTYQMDRNVVRNRESRIIDTRVPAKQSLREQSSSRSKSPVVTIVPDKDCTVRADPVPLTEVAFNEYLREEVHKAEIEHFETASALIKRANHLSDRNRTSIIQEDVDLTEDSPFAVLKALTPISGSSKKGKIANERLLAHYVPSDTHSKAPEPLHLYVIDTYSAPTHVIPVYTHYNSSKRNILVEGDRQKTFLPYLGENMDDIEDDYRALEVKVAENQSRTQALSDNEDFAHLWLCKIDKILEALGTNVEAVLRVLLDNQADGPRKLLPKQHVKWLDYREDWITEGFFEEQDDIQATKGDDTHQPRRPQKQWLTALENLPEVGDRALAAAVMACFTFMDVIGFSLWHVVRLHPIAIAAARRSGPFRNEEATSSRKNDLDAFVDKACLVCKAHQCFGHGEFSEDEDGQHVRITMTSGCGLESLHEQTERALNLRGKETPNCTQDLLGKDLDGLVRGLAWTVLSDDPPGFEDHETCSGTCFWEKRNRSPQHVNLDWSQTDNDFLQLIGPVYANQRRGACVVASMKVLDKTCAEIFPKLIRLSLPIVEASEAAANSSSGRTYENKSSQWWFKNTKTWQQDQRDPFTPCRHRGKCKNNPDCSCDRAKISCEKSCRCLSNCSRRFRGCRCQAHGAKTCAEDESCDCRALNRECDPDLCENCGAHKVLDPVNRYDEAVARARCTNVCIQRAVPKRTQLGQSRLLAAGGVVGWGLFMGEKTRKSEYIGEYVGEIVTAEEAEQRGIIYNAMNLSYLFDLNAKQVLDSTPIGNKLRYINHQSDEFANCKAKVLFCGGVQRIGMFATKNIAVGEELLFNYGHNFASKIDCVKMSKDGTVYVVKAKGDDPAVEEEDEIDGDDLPEPISSNSRPNEPRAGRKRRHSALDPKRGEVVMADVDEGFSSAEDELISEEEEEDDDDNDDDEGEVHGSGQQNQRKRAVILPGGMTGSDRMKKAWISRYRRLGRHKEAEEQEKKLKESLRARKRSMPTQMGCRK